MDSDSPTLPPDCLAHAFLALETAGAVLGPCEDGGYYLIGLTRSPAAPAAPGSDVHVARRPSAMLV